MVADDLVLACLGRRRIDDHVAGSPGLWLPALPHWFAVGIGLALVHVQHQQGQHSRRRRRVVALGRQPGVCWSLAAGLMLVAATPLAGPTLLEAPTVAESIAKHLLYAAIGTLLVLSGVFAVPGAYRDDGVAPLRHLGHIATASSASTWPCWPPPSSSPAPRSSPGTACASGRPPWRCRWSRRRSSTAWWRCPRCG